MSNVKAMPQPLRVVDHGTNQINLEHISLAAMTGRYYVKNARIEEMHMKRDGTHDHKPIIAFSAVVPGEGFIVSSISINTLDFNLKKLGFKVVPL